MFQIEVIPSDHRAPKPSGHLRRLGPQYRGTATLIFGGAAVARRGTAVQFGKVQVTQPQEVTGGGMGGGHMCSGGGVMRGGRTFVLICSRETIGGITLDRAGRQFPSLRVAGDRSGCLGESDAASPKTITAPVGIGDPTLAIQRVKLTTAHSTTLSVLLLGSNYSDNWRQRPDPSASFAVLDFSNDAAG